MLRESRITSYPLLANPHYRMMRRTCEKKNCTVLGSGRHTHEMINGNFAELSRAAFFAAVAAIVVVWHLFPSITR